MNAILNRFFSKAILLTNTFITQILTWDHQRIYQTLEKNKFRTYNDPQKPAFLGRIFHNLDIEITISTLRSKWKPNNILLWNHKKITIIFQM